MKSRFQSVNEVYHTYVKNHLGDNPLQNILTCGGSESAVETELLRHKEFIYENMFHYEMIDSQIHYDEVIKDNILCPDKPMESVNLVYADAGYTGVESDTPSWDIKNGVLKILENGFIDNKLGILVFLYFDGAILEPFLDKQYGEYKSRDFFSSNIVWDDGYGLAEQRLDGVVFYE